jgi:hypothetical protein
MGFGWENGGKVEIFNGRKYINIWKIWRIFKKLNKEKS